LEQAVSDNRWFRKLLALKITDLKITDLENGRNCGI
jgi:hypothetical protein